MQEIEKPATPQADKQSRKPKMSRNHLEGPGGKKSLQNQEVLLSLHPPLVLFDRELAALPSQKSDKSYTETLLTWQPGCKVLCSKVDANVILFSLSFSLSLTLLWTHVHDVHVGEWPGCLMSTFGHSALAAALLRNLSNGKQNLAIIFDL